jgi:hypothetical protein
VAISSSEVCYSDEEKIDKYTSVYITALFIINGFDFKKGDRDFTNTKETIITYILLPWAALWYS